MWRVGRGFFYNPSGAPKRLGFCMPPSHCDTVVGGRVVSGGGRSLDFFCACGMFRPRPAPLYSFRKLFMVPFRSTDGATDVHMRAWGK